MSDNHPPQLPSWTDKYTREELAMFAWNRTWSCHKCVNHETTGFGYKSTPACPNYDHRMCSHCPIEWKLRRKHQFEHADLNHTTNTNGNNGYGGGNYGGSQGGGGSYGGSQGGGGGSSSSTVYYANTQGGPSYSNNPSSRGYYPPPSNNYYQNSGGQGGSAYNNGYGHSDRRY